MADGEKYSLLSTEQGHLHSRALEEFPEGPYGSTLLTEKLGKSSGWDTGEENEQRFGYEAEGLHDGLPRLDPGADPIRYKGDGMEEETPANYEKQ